LQDINIQLSTPTELDTPR